MTIEQELLKCTPLPLDIIRFCVEPYIIPDHAHWRRQFDSVVKDICFYHRKISEIYNDCQNIRKWHAHCACCRGRSILSVSFTFTNIDAYNYNVRYRLRDLKKPKPSLISRIKSWLGRHC